MIEKTESSKKWVLRFRANDKSFEKIIDNRKTVETRAATDKYKKVKVGDRLVIVCGKNRLEKEVKKVEHFKSIEAMIKKIPFRKVMPSVSSVAEMKKVYEGYTGYKEKLKKFGLVAWTLK